MDPRELVLILGVFGFLAVATLALIATRSISRKLRRSFPRAFAFAFFLLAGPVIGTALWRLPTGYSSTVRIDLTSPGTPNQAPGTHPTVNDLEAIVKSPAFLQPVLALLPVRELFGAPCTRLELNDSDASTLLARAIRIKPLPNTSTIEISVFGENRLLPSQFANRIAEELVDTTPIYGPLPSVRILSKAQPPLLPLFSSATRNAVIGLIASLAIALLIACVRPGHSNGAPGVMRPTTPDVT